MQGRMFKVYVDGQDGQDSQGCENDNSTSGGFFS